MRRLKQPFVTAKRVFLFEHVGETENRLDLIDGQIAGGKKRTSGRSGVDGTGMD